MKTKHIETALVVGGGSGMGRAVAQRLGALGIRIFVADLLESSLTDTVRNISDQGGLASGLRVDTSRSESVRGLFQTLKDQTPRLDLMVYTAGILGRTVFIEDMEDEEWHRIISVNLYGTFYCCREAVRWMKAQRNGRIILFSSVASLTPTPGSLHYSASKGGVNMLGKTLAREVADYNIRVNIIAPGYIETPMLKNLPEGFPEYVHKRTPLKRLGEVTEVAGLVAFLASPEADFFTGQVISPNGGWVI